MLFGMRPTTLQKLKLFSNCFNIVYVWITASIPRFAGLAFFSGSYALFMEPVSTFFFFFRKTTLKLGHTVLFTHLKIILLQYFQFSFFNFSNNKFNPNNIVKLKLALKQSGVGEQGLRSEQYYPSLSLSHKFLTSIFINFYFFKKKNYYQTNNSYLVKN